MKTILLSIIFLLFTCTGFAQTELSFGAKAGLNSNSNGDLNIFGGIAGVHKIFDSNPEIGYQIGGYVRYDVKRIYFKSEILFTKTTSSYDEVQSSSKFKMSSFEVPILVGYTILNPVSIYAGPSSRYIVNTDFFTSFDLELDKSISLDFNFGIALQFDKIGIDLRYVTGLSHNKASYTNDLAIDGFGYSLDIKPKLFTLSISYQINNHNANGGGMIQKKLF